MSSIRDPGPVKPERVSFPELTEIGYNTVCVLLTSNFLLLLYKPSNLWGPAGLVESCEYLVLLCDRVTSVLRQTRPPFTWNLGLWAI